MITDLGALKMKKIVQKQLGELLIERKAITQPQLDEALRAQKEKGGLLGEVLVRLGYVTEEMIAYMLTAQYGIPYLPLANYEIEEEVVKTVSEERARRYGMIAVDRVGDVLTLAMSNPLNSQAIEEIEAETGLKVQIFVATATDVNRAIQRFYKK